MSDIVNGSMRLECKSKQSFSILICTIMPMLFIHNIEYQQGIVNFNVSLERINYTRNGGRGKLMVFV